MIIFDNIIYNLQKNGGISVYWTEICKRAIQNKYNIYFIEYNNNNSQRNTINISKSKIINSRNYYLLIDRFVFSIFPIIKVNKNKFIHHSSYFRLKLSPNVKNVITVHDCIHEKYLNGIKKQIHIFFKKIAMNYADAIITVSNNTRNDLLTLYPYLNKDKISVIYNGVSNNLSYNNRNIKKNILFIGSREKYKNFQFAVNAISELDDYNLIIVGSKLSNKEVIFLNDKLENRWINHINISNEKLNYLYNTSFALLYPSAYEGFGIPIVEAMKTGCPFIALKSSSIVEISSGAGILLDSANIDDFLNAIRKIEKNRHYYVEIGLEKSKIYSWDKCFEQTVTLYNKLLSS
jgi:mannosyltransferase